MWRYVLVGTLLVVGGCGAAREVSSMRQDAAPSAQSTPSAPGAKADSAEALNKQAADQQRKIIYEADVSLIVDDFSRIEREIPRLVKEYGGYFAQSLIDRTQGAQLSGQWVARIPVDKYDAFLDAVSKLGLPERQNQTAQDVTDQYVDLQAQIANKKRLEQRILELLAKPGGEMKEVIEVERELARVRGEIEQMEGRLRYLENRTAFTTVTIRAVERRDYVPPQAPTFLNRIRQAGEGSLTSLLHFAQGLTILAVVLLPWLVVLAVVLAIVVWLIRLLRGRRPARRE